MERMTVDKALNDYLHGLDCSQVVISHATDRVDLDVDELRRVASAFGGGMMHGRTCGCVTGALMALGLFYGHSKEGEDAKKQLLIEKITEFEKRFTEEAGSVVCKELLGYEIPKDLEEIRSQNLMMERCPVFACIACDILDEIME